jgi:hypothetical protein
VNARISKNAEIKPSRLLKKEINGIKNTAQDMKEELNKYIKSLRNKTLN